MKLMLYDVRLAFPSLFEPRGFASDGNSKPAYSATFIFAPNHTFTPKDLDGNPIGQTIHTLKEVEAAIEKAAREKWGQKADQILKQLKAQDRTFLHDGNLKAQYAGFDGNLFISARSYMKPAVVDQRRRPLGPNDGIPYAGCRVNAILEVYAQDNQYGKRINAILRGVQFFRDDEAFSGGVPASPDDFEEFGSAEEIDFL